jgi:hypothetical protein
MKTLKILKVFFLAILTVTGFVSCKSTGLRALTQGNYYTACIQAVDKLRSSPDNTKAMDALSQAYPLAVSYTNNEVERLLIATSDNSRYQKIFDLYNKMNEIAVQISRSPVALRIVPNANYYNYELETARNRAAEECYQLAETNFRAGTRIAAKQAHQQYVKVNSLIAGYKDVDNKIQEAKWMATLKVILEQVPVEGSYKLSADFFQNKVFEYFTNSLRNEYISVFSPEEAKATRLNPDQIIRLRFLDFVVGQIRESGDTYEIKRDSVKTGTYKDNRGVTHNVYNTVKAKITVRKKEVSSNGVLDVFIVDYGTNTVLSQQRFPGSYVWTDSYATFNGDERALSQKELELCNRSSLSSPPAPQDMFVEFTVPIYTSLTRFIQNYYRNY